MKRTLFLLGIILLLTACGGEEEPTSNEPTQTSQSEETQQEENTNDKQVNDFTITDEAKQERDEFIEAFNSYEEVESIDNVQEPREESKAAWQLLYDDEANIEIKYNEDGEVIGYHTSFDPDSEDGLLYASIAAESLGLDLDTFLDHVDQSVSGEDADYNENNYDITFTNMMDLGMFTINFDK